MQRCIDKMPDFVKKLDLILFFPHRIIIIMSVKEVFSVLNKLNTSEEIRNFVADFKKRNGKQRIYGVDFSETNQVMLI